MLKKLLNRLQKCSTVVRTSLDVFGNFQKFLENCWKSLEVAGAFSKITAMTEKKLAGIGMYVEIIIDWFQNVCFLNFRCLLKQN